MAAAWRLWQATKMEDPETRETAIIHIGRLMKTFYNTWNKDNIEDEIILKQIKQLSDNQLDIDIEKVKENGWWNNHIKERRHHNRDNNRHRNRNHKHRRRN